MKNKTIGIAILGSCLALCATYLQIHQDETPVLVWIGVLICALSLIDD